jgi:hypothetical protein
MSEKKTFLQSLLKLLEEKYCPSRFGLKEMYTRCPNKESDCYKCWENTKKKWEEENR